MSLSLPRYLILGLLLVAGAALALAIGYWNISPASFTPSATITDDSRPDFYIDNAQILALDEKGKTLYQLTAEHAVHQISDGSTHLQQPELLFRRGEDPLPWRLKADEGLVTEQGDRVDLTTDVVLEQQLEGQQARQLTTSALTLFPARDYAETNRSVNIKTARSVTTAEGLQLHLNDGRMTLLSTVRGHYEVR